MRLVLRSLALAPALLVGLATAAHAQGPQSTGSFVGGRDTNWDVAVGAGAFVDAFQVVNNPGWNDFAGPTNARWISYNASATGPGGTPYTFRTTFDLTGYDPTTASLSFTCGMDNNVDGVFLNGVAVGGASCQYHGLGAVQTISAGYASGVNTLDFVISGDQVTDGFIYNTTGFSARALPTSSVPEPATYLMLATGLGAIGVIKRRRGARR